MFKINRVLACGLLVMIELTACRNPFADSSAQSADVKSEKSRALSSIASLPCTTPSRIPAEVRGMGVPKLRRFNGLNQIANCGDGQTVAVVIGSIGNIQADLAVYSEAFGLPLPTAANFEIVYANAPKNTCNNTELPIEAHLDVEMVHAIAPRAKIILACPDDATFAGKARAINAAIRAGAQVISMSWGRPENQENYNLLEPIFSSHPEITFLAGSGDSGSNVFDGTEHVAYPAGSPFVLAVGATIDTGADTLEGWDKSGGGQSKFIPRPQYQMTLPSQDFPGNNRLLPDFSLNGSEASPVAVYTQGRWATAHGSSVSAPLGAGMIALANEQHGAPLGYINDKMYSILAAGQLNLYFRDVVKGNNGFEAGVGYDLVGGLGSTRMNVLIPFLAR